MSPAKRVDPLRKYPWLLPNLLTGSLVVRQLTGSAGSTGTYEVTPPQVVVSEAMTGTNLVNDITMNINQAPVVAPVNVRLAVQA
jgi:hypothetical protein